jgi:hypothetical protein
MNRVLTLFACVLLSAPAYGQVREIGQVKQTGDQAARSGSIVISEPGSYRLVSNIVMTGSDPAIDIRTDNVTLDLNGFLVDAQGGGAAIYGIRPTGASGLVVINGNIHSVGDGIVLVAGNCRVEQVVVQNVARRGIGIKTGGNCAIRHTIVRGANLGISCIFCPVENNIVAISGDAGITATNGSLVFNNRVSEGQVGLLLDATTGYGNNVLNGNGTDASGGVQIGANLCASAGICP